MYVFISGCVACNCSTYGRSSAQCEPQNGKCLCRRLLCLCLFQAVSCVIALRTAVAVRSVNHRTGSVRVRRTWLASSVSAALLAGGVCQTKHVLVSAPSQTLFFTFENAFFIFEIPNISYLSC